MSIKSNCVPIVANGANTNSDIGKSLGDLLITRRDQLLSTTVDLLTVGSINGNGTTVGLGTIYSNGYRLAYLKNRANSVLTCNTLNDAGSIVTSAYEGNAVVPSNNPNNLSR